MIKKIEAHLTLIPTEISIGYIIQSKILQSFRAYLTPLTPLTQPLFTAPYHPLDFHESNLFSEMTTSGISAHTAAESFYLSLLYPSPIDLSSKRFRARCMAT